MSLVVPGYPSLTILKYCYCLFSFFPLSFFPTAYVTDNIFLIMLRFFVWKQLSSSHFEKPSGRTQLSQPAHFYTHVRSSYIQKIKALLKKRHYGLTEKLPYTTEMKENDFLARGDSFMISI